MATESLLYFIIVLTAVFINAVVTAYAWRHRDVHGASTFLSFLVCADVWGFSFVAMSLAGTSTWALLFWYIIMTCIALIPVAWLNFALGYTGRQHWLTLPIRIALGVIPAITILLNWTNHWHGRLYREFELYQSGLLSVQRWKPGAWFYIHSVYSYALILIGLIFLAWSAFRAFRAHRWQAVMLLLGVLAPLLSNIPTTLQWTEMPTTFIGFVFTGVAFTFAIFRYQLFSLAPVARSTVIDTMPAGMMVINQQNHVLDINPAMRAILGLSSEDELLGKDVSALMHNTPSLREEIRDVSFARSEIALDHSGSKRYYDMRLAPMTNRQGVITARLLTLRDITERKQAEESLRQYTAELEASNAELDAFARTVAHDLKNPLTGLVGFSMLMEKRHLEMTTEQVTDGLHRIARSGRKMTNIVEELLLLASARKADSVQTGPVDMHMIVTGALERLRDLRAETGAEIIVAEDWPVAIGYAPWLEEVWANYTSNALKYGGKPDLGIPPMVELGWGGLDVEEFEQVAQAHGPDAYVYFWVRDNGPGLAPEARDQLFVEFSRLEQTRAQGHGLGLSIVQRVVEKLGGQVGVESQPGHGCTFWFSLPRQSPSLAEEVKDDES